MVRKGLSHFFKSFQDGEKCYYFDNLTVKNTDFEFILTQIYQYSIFVDSDTYFSDLFIISKQKKKTFKLFLKQESV